MTPTEPFQTLAAILEQLKPWFPEEVESEIHLEFGQSVAADDKVEKMVEEIKARFNWIAGMLSYLD